MLAAQTETGFEVIVSDAGSTDGTLELLEAESRFNLVWRSSPDGGIYDGMNIGIDKARGHWFLFLGADDQLAAAETLAHTRELLERTNLDIFSCAVRYTGKRNPLVPHIHTPVYGKRLRWKNTLHHQGTFYRATLFASQRFDLRFPILADYHFNLTCWKRGKLGEVHPNIVAMAGAQGISKGFKWAQYREELRVKQDVLGWGERLLQTPWVWFKFVAKQMGRLI